MPSKKKEPIAEVYDSVTDGLKSLYRTKIRPVEEVRARHGARRAVQSAVRSSVGRAHATAQCGGQFCAETHEPDWLKHLAVESEARRREARHAGWFAMPRVPKDGVLSPGRFLLEIMTILTIVVYNHLEIGKTSKFA